MDNPQTLYKLMILYILSRVSFPITRSQISDFILERDYTDFLTLQQAFAQLIETNLIDANTMRNRTHLAITEEGLNTLSFFKNQISPEIIADIDEYLQAKKYDLENEVSITSRYQKNLRSDCLVELCAKEKDQELLSINLTVPTESMAEAICNNWQKKNQDIYKYLTEQLF